MKVDILKKAERFDVNINSFDHLNDNVSLYMLYEPIVGNLAIQIYQYLVVIYRIKVEANFCKTNLVDLIDHFGLDLEQFCEKMNLLEATGLIKTYWAGDENNQKLTFVVQKMLNFNDFMASNTLKNALEKSLSPSKFNELRYIFNKHFAKAVDISESKNYLNTFVHNLPNNTSNIYVNWHEIKNNLLFLGYKVNFLEDDKNIILNFYLNSTITISGLMDLIVSSLDKPKNNDCYKFNSNKFTTNINSPIQTSINFNKTISRNVDIFSFNADVKKFASIVNDYKSFSCENYLNSLTKEDISLDVRKTLSKIKDNFDLTDAAINVLIDYSMYKNVGHFRSNYVYKIANTISNANILEPNEIIKYLQCIDNKTKPNIYSIKNDKITDSNNEDVWD